MDFFQGEFNYVSRERMKYVGNNKYLKNQIYSTIAPDQYLYFKSNNPQFLNLEQVKITDVFENPSEAAVLECNNNDTCELLDMNFPLEEALIPNVIGMALKELLGAAYRPKDDENNASDDMADLMAYVRRNMKNDFTK